MERPPTLSPRLPVAPTGVPIDLRAFKDDHRGDNQCHPGNLGLLSFTRLNSAWRAMAGSKVAAGSAARRAREGIREAGGGVIGLTPQNTE